MSAPVCCDADDPSRNEECAERASCPDAGKPGHTACGTCPHGKPRHRPCDTCR